ncbi:nuclease s1 [Polychaeton citri CBS 116435]|uniref:Nuclease s1 n=1 Tax=Polychaeton citri CBS 116435 TaxID=1314669 RepID=A0A9P4Q7P9_9PEZI|nr:nuclease s1 [Polychaeton citri CBS 116435]
MAALTLIGLAGLLQGVSAWGSLGHETVAYIAQDYIKDTTKSWAQGILSDTSDSYLASHATWADTYRYTAAGKYSAPYHFIDAMDSPPSSCNVDYERDCPAEGCSISAIANFTQRVNDGRLSAEHKLEALQFLIHFLGDITQPLHDENYKLGGNDVDVTYDGDSTNLHHIWDTNMPESLRGGYALTDAQSWASDIVTDINSGKYSSEAASWVQGDEISDAIGSATRWASDANAYVCSTVVPNGWDSLSSGDLYPDYYKSSIDVIELQIAKGGYRLAGWLDQLADADAKRKRWEEVAPVLRRGPMKAPKIGTFAGPNPKKVSKATLARRAVGWGCNHKH